MIQLRAELRQLLPDMVDDPAGRHSPAYLGFNRFTRLESKTYNSARQIVQSSEVCL